MNLNDLLPKTKKVNYAKSDDNLIKSNSQGMISLKKRKPNNRVVCTQFFHVKIGVKSNKTLQKRFSILTPISLLVYNDEQTYTNSP